MSVCFSTFERCLCTKLYSSHSGPESPPSVTPGGGRLHTTCTQMCVLRTYNYTHFEGYCLRKNIPIMKRFFYHRYPILKDNCLGIITKDRNAELNSLGYRLL